MGNDPYKYIHYNIKEEDIKKVLTQEKRDKIYEIYAQRAQYSGHIQKENFNDFIKLDDDQIYENLFKIFSSRNKIYFSDLIDFYVSFSNEDLKYILFSFLIFGKVAKIDINTYKKSLTQFICLDDYFAQLMEPKFIELITLKQNKYSYIPDFNFFTNSKEEYIDKSFFQTMTKKRGVKISFFEKVIPSSKLFEKEMNKKYKHYVCDCEKQYLVLNSIDDLETMERPFKVDKLVTKGHLSFANFEIIMKDLDVNKKLIDLIIKYLQRNTMKDSINFNDFKNLMLNVYAKQSVTNKKSFLFKMILTIYNQKNSIKANQLKKIFEIDDKECKVEGIIDKQEFEKLNDPIMNSQIDTYLCYMENLGLLPYIRYNIEVQGQDLKKRIINFILKQRTIEEYLIENFDKNDKFYPISKEFWNSIIEPDVMPELKINNSLIAEKDPIYYISVEDKNKSNKNIPNNNDNDNKDSTSKKEENEKSNETDNKSQQSNKDNKNENIEIKQKKKESIKAKLKAGVKYNVDYVIICGEIYQRIKDYFEIDYLVELEKTIIYLEPKEDELKKEEEKNEEKKEGKEEEKKEGKEEEKKEEKIEDKKEENKIEVNEEKLEINTEKNYLRKKENKIKGIKEYVVDFYPIITLQLSFNDIVKEIEGRYIKMEKQRKDEEFEKMSKEEKEEILNELNTKKKNRTKLYKEYEKKFDEIQELYRQNKIDKKFMDEKIINLNNTYRAQINPEKNIKMTKTKFIEVLKLELNRILSSSKIKFRKRWKSLTVLETKYHLIKFNNFINLNNFDLIYYTLDNEYSILEDEKSFNDLKLKDFALIIIDKKNKEGKSNFTLLEENEESSEECEINTEIDTKDFEVLSKDELKKIEDEQKEKERIKKEKERLEKEKQEKEKKKSEKKISPPYGIPNFGNTCYFNAVNQIFLNLPIMQKLFSNKNLKYMINKENKFGYKGKLISTLMPLYELYSYQIEDNIRSLKSLVGKLKETFNNREQQDAHEYLNFLLEGLHEELNIKSSKIYIVDNDDNYKYNTEDELGNIAWANNLRRNVSFIDSIFMFQLKSNLTCRKCGTKKVNFESSYVFDLPLSLCKMVTVHINLFRLPFKYKIYYNQISKNFDDFLKLEENKNKNITEILCEYYSEKLTYEQKKEQAVDVTLEFDYEREKCIGDLIKHLRKITLLELESENISVNIDNSEIKEYKVNHVTEFITYSHNKMKLIKNDTIIDKFVDINDTIVLDIYEVLNTNGFCLINKNYLQVPNYNIYSYKFNKKGTTFNDFKAKIQNTNYFISKTKESDIQSNNNDTPKPQISQNDNKIESNSEDKKNIINIISIDNKINYLENNEKDVKNNTSSSNIISEFIIPIVHYHRNLSEGAASIFLDFYHSKMKNFPTQFLVLNNSTSSKITSNYLYNYIWDFNSLYMNHPNKKIDKFWFNLDQKSSQKSKKCYPFIIRIVKRNSKYSNSYKCAKCHWYNFCIGCVLYPDDNNLILENDSIIFVEWCNTLIKEEIDEQNFYKKIFTFEEITLCIESSVKNDKNNEYQSINDCFSLFFEKELLEDPLSCRVCGGPQNFIKNYEINKLPYVLILSLKRFKYNENNNFKLKQLITYPVDNFQLKDKKYNLFGVVYHYGSINSGHYICSIRHNKKWIVCDDNSVYEIEQKRVMNSNAYILFYISEDSLNNYSYYNCIKSLLQHLVPEKSKKAPFFTEEKNFFSGEPIRVKSKGNGYVVEDYLEDFIIEENKDEKCDDNTDDNEKEKIEDKNIKEENKINESKEEDMKNVKETEGKDIIINNKKDGNVKVKFESIKEVEIINKKDIEKLILIDEQKEKNECNDK